MHPSVRLVCLAAAVALSGCAVVQVKPEGRVASDQLLISMSIEDAVRALDFGGAVGNKTVQLTVVHNGSVDRDLSYLQQVVRAQVVQSGGRVVTADADLELVTMVQTVGSDIDQSKFGLPIPLPAVGTIAMSEAVFYADSKQIGRCRLWCFAVDRQGKIVFTHRPVHHAHMIRNPVLLGLTLGKWSDLKELNKSRGPIPIQDPGMTRGYVK